MCGLVGAFRADNANLQKLDHFMWQGLYMSALRGMGGTGVGVVHKDYDTDFAKSHVSAPNFLCSEEWDWIDKQLLSCRAVLGHTRSATQGSVKTRNSHPFMHEDKEGNGVLMIHNGHIKNWHALTPTMFHHEVDSAHVAHSIFHKGGLETLKELEGAYTLVWYDKKTKTMNLARNEERELFCTYNKDKSCFWFASELDMLSCILKRNGIPHERDFFELPKFTLCSFDLTKTKLDIVKTEYEEKKYQPVFQNANDGLYSNARGNNENFRDFTKTNVSAGDCIWVNIKESDDVAVTLYKAIGDGENEVSQEHAYGYVYGTRSMDLGSVVRVVGVGYNDWNNRLKFVKNCLPCKIIRIEKGLINEQTGEKYLFMEATIMSNQVDTEILRSPISQAIRRKRADEEAARKAAALTAGRSLPVPVLPKNIPPVEPPAAGLELGQNPGLVAQQPGVGPILPGRGREPAVGLVHPEFTSNPTHVPGPRGTKMPFSEWEKISEEGCYICDGVILPNDIGQVEWWEHPRNVEDRKPEDAEYQMICPTCKDNPKKILELVG